MRQFVMAIFIIFIFPISTRADFAEDMQLSIESYQKADKELNEVWKLAIRHIETASLDPPVRAKWIEQQRAAQQAWIKFRDADAEVIEYSWYGGHGLPLAKIGWQQKLTEERTAHLREQYHIR